MVEKEETCRCPGKIPCRSLPVAGACLAVVPSLTRVSSLFAYFQITMHLSMNEQQAVLPWIKTFPKKVVQRVPIYLWPFGSFAAIYGLVEFTNTWDYSEDISHRF
jgi:hypothetical protein